MGLVIEARHRIDAWLETPNFQQLGNGLPPEGPIPRIAFPNLNFPVRFVLNELDGKALHRLVLSFRSPTCLHGIGNSTRCPVWATPICPRANLSRGCSGGGSSTRG